MTRKELKVFRGVSSQLTEAYDILKKIEEKNPYNPTEDYGQSLVHARVQVLLADCKINHQVYLKERENY